MSLNCSKEFLEYLATKTRNHGYRIFDHYVYINGGKRVDSVSNYKAPNLDPEATIKLVKSNIDTILRHAAHRHVNQVQYKNELHTQKNTHILSST